jgi:hypothetical protein
MRFAPYAFRLAGFGVSNVRVRPPVIVRFTFYALLEHIRLI